MLRSYIIRAVGGLAILAGATLGQVITPSKFPLSFEVASIKPVGPLDSGVKPGMSVDNDRVYIGSLSLMELVCQAYEVSRNQIVAGPAWLSRQDSERFAIVAKMPDGAVRKQVPEMLRALLAARFRLVAHREKRDTSVYALVVAKGGPRLEEAAADPPALGETKASEALQPNQSANGETASSKPAAAKDNERPSVGGGERPTISRTAGGFTINGRGFRRTVSEHGQVRFEYDSLTMERFASLLSQYLDRPVVENTELKGNYRVSYEIDVNAIATAMMNKDSMSVGKPDDQILDPGAAIFSSVRKLGLKLDARILPCDVLVVDHVEKTPTEN